MWDKEAIIESRIRALPGYVEGSRVVVSTAPSPSAVSQARDGSPPWATVALEGGLKGLRAQQGQQAMATLARI